MDQSSIERELRQLRSLQWTMFIQQWRIVEPLNSSRKLAANTSSTAELQQNRSVVMHFKRVKPLKNQFVHYKHI